MIEPRLIFVRVSPSSNSGSASPIWPADWYASARLLMLVRVSLWIGPSLALRPASDSTRTAIARSL